jgi:nicotinamide phosphoribosyltransferase
VALGVGSLSMQCIEVVNQCTNEKSFSPYTRDTFGIAVKATYAEDKDGNPIMIFKNPVTDDSNFKKSQRGCCRVSFDGDNYSYVDGLTWAESQEDNELKTVFKDGKFVRRYLLQEVRSNLHNGNF